MKILIVDDHDFNRELLSFILTDAEHECIEAENGIEAVEKYQSMDDLDLVLMDINMPEMDGISATKKIKQLDTIRHVPIIFVTALDDFDMLSQCLEAGGDDFVPKPVNESVLLAKINAHMRTKNLYSKLQEVNQTLNLHQQQVEREHSIVERVFEKSTNRVRTYCSCAKKYTSPASMFNGDLVLESPSPAGGVYHLVGDFTGHGLSASIGTLPVADIFYALAGKQASVSQIASEINSRLSGLLPSNMFFCAAISYLSPSGTELSLWSGGMNDILITDADDPSHLQYIHAEHMPLAVLPVVEFDGKPTIITLKPGDRVYIYTDGVNEAKNAEGEEFGLPRLEDIIKQGGEDVVRRITGAVHSFSEGKEQSDDISLIELTSQEIKHYDVISNALVETKEVFFKAKSFPWKFSMHLEDKDLRNANIVDQIMNVVGTVQCVEIHRDKIFTILSELYSNALEHGILELDSNLKDSADGFEQYYREREQRLKKVSGQAIDIDFSYIKGQPDCLILTMTDTGIGFDYQKAGETHAEGNDPYGRGVALLRSLCSKIEYSNEGRTVVVHYELGLEGGG
ncbi:Chemotaxis protein CheY [Thalassocella blandensis]|nr:Chemotaxis protein CheY [Thalassocella blandensis]